MHLADFRFGGYSGRPHAFLVGLDEARHPGAGLEDPVLLDAERERLNKILSPGPGLAMRRDQPRDSAAALRACVARLPGSLTASYSAWDVRGLSQQGPRFPSPFFLELHRRAAGRPGADYGELLEAMPEPAGFAPRPEDALDETEWWLARRRVRGGAGGGAAAPPVRMAYPWLADGFRAETARDSEEFTVWDGWISGGTPQLDPRLSGEPQSASRLERLSSCPFAYFLEHVLRLESPEEVERDPTRWLEPMKAGSLLHEVFRLFFEEITSSRSRSA
jgi:hypothetical protein